MHFFRDTAFVDECFESSFIFQTVLSWWRVGRQDGSKMVERWTFVSTLAYFHRHSVT